MNVRLHMIVRDGVYAPEGKRLRFHRLNAPDPQHLETLLNRIIAGVTRLVMRAGSHGVGFGSKSVAKITTSHRHRRHDDRAKHGAHMYPEDRDPWTHHAAGRDSGAYRPATVR